jgi:hypothetical protein
VEEGSVPRGIVLPQPGSVFAEVCLAGIIQIVSPVLGQGRLLARSV